MTLTYTKFYLSESLTKTNKTAGVTRPVHSWTQWRERCQQQ